jgi:lipid II:glycine glycyltransferase (peptidoglycan interpeptide bridge formation enzyme)
MGAPVTESGWQVELDRERWDGELAALDGHPLQSTLWGEARRQADGTEYRCFALRGGGRALALARVEIRRVPALGRLAWIPRGPVTAAGLDGMPGLLQRLRQDGFVLCASTGWPPREAPSADAASVPGPKTLWIDLTMGRERLLANLDSQWRYGARRAIREGVTVEQTSRADDVAVFFGLCESISAAKRFALPGSRALVENLLRLSREPSAVQARLFVARFQGALVAGALVIHAGARAHYFWGGVDRAHSKLRAGEAVQWAVLEWAVGAGLRLYDLEGVDPERNPGTYEFKKKMGGRLMALPDRVISPLTWRGRVLAPFL